MFVNPFLQGITRLDHMQPVGGAQLVKGILRTVLDDGVHLCAVEGGVEVLTGVEVLFHELVFGGFGHCVTACDACHLLM